MKNIIEYKLHDGHVPYFVGDGGYFIIGKKFIGVSIDDTNSYIPKSADAGGDLVYLTNQNLIDRVVSIAMNDMDGNELTAEQKTEIANNWLNSKGF